MAMSTELNLFKLCSKPLVGLLHSFAVHPYIWGGGVLCHAFLIFSHVLMLDDYNHDQSFKLWGKCKIIPASQKLF